MGMPQVVRVWTREEVLALPDDGNRYELVDGELLVSPSPAYRHQRALVCLFNRLWPYVQKQRLGEMLWSPADLDLNSQQLVQPDLFVLPPYPSARPRRDWSEAGIPVLAVEVISPSTARHDRITKRTRYQRSGIGEYWIIDVDARVIERWTPEDVRPEVVADVLTWQPSGATEGWELNLAEYFGEVWGEDNEH